MEENAARERQFPGILLDQTPAGYVRLLERQFAEAFWCEYAVCRISARLARNEEQRFRENLPSRLNDARPHAREAIRSYRTHRDVERVLQEVGGAALEPLRIASYLFGHLDGTSDEECDVAAELQAADPIFVAAIGELVSQMRLLWNRRGAWETHDDMLVLGRTAFALIRVCGVHAIAQPDGRAYISVPFTADTNVATSLVRDGGNRTAAFPLQEVAAGGVIVLGGSFKSAVVSRPGVEINSLCRCSRCWE
ncbi:MAG: hypothetical protein EOS10_34245 [Mesorhizobium sp.]|uniref:hypothetical protein n=1 Tax=Mesorhizobium sp. TaxID=1871066 RepID=UPI000FE536B2|nr:hypothetical protein [Mesorhizobium sp.]RWO23175.1 MAG: hypothetical protein EOS10_34245 [Mesorhizobium sp.]